MRKKIVRTSFVTFCILIFISFIYLKSHNFSEYQTQEPTPTEATPTQIPVTEPNIEPTYETIHPTIPTQTTSSIDHLIGKWTIAEAHYGSYHLTKEEIAENINIEDNYIECTEQGTIILHFSEDMSDTDSYEFTFLYENNNILPIENASIANVDIHLSYEHENIILRQNEIILVYEKIKE